MSNPSLINAVLLACVGLTLGSHLLAPMSGPAYLDCDRTPFIPQEEAPEDAVTIGYHVIAHERRALSVRATAKGGNVVCATTTRQKGLAPWPEEPGGARRL
jgi:hypothetical protein